MTDATISAAPAMPARRRGRPPKAGLVDARDRLVRSGVAILTEKGFSAVGLDEILKSAGIPKGSFYHYFDGKEAFGAALIDAYAAYFARKLDRWFLAYEEGAFGSASFEATQQLFSDMEISGESFQSAAAGGGDYTAVLERAKEYDPDVFIWAGYDADALPIMEQARAIDFAPPLFVGAPPGWPASFGESGLAEGVTLYGMWAPSLNSVSDVSAHYYQSYVSTYDEEPATYFAPLGYTAVMILAQAVEAAVRQAECGGLLIELETAHSQHLPRAP